MNGPRTFVIGDIHGCLDPLRRLMERIPWEPATDCLVFVGDYIDRGPDSKGVVDFILQLRRLGASVRCVLGNHERMLLDFLAERNQQLYMVNGGLQTLESYHGRGCGQGPEAIPAEHMAFYRSLEPYLELPECFVVHAGFRPGVPLDSQSQEDLTWIREAFIYSDCDFGKPVIFGHTPFYEPYMDRCKIGIDTGAVYGGRLTCLELPARRFHSVRA